MKLIAILISIAVVVLVVVGYDLLMKAAKRKQTKHIDELNTSLNDFWQEQKMYENLQHQIIEKKNESESTNSKQSKKTKSQNTNGK
jgi:Sec-independent protein translocase protein TatA